LANAEQKATEPYVEIDEENVLYLAYSDYKEDVVIALNNGKNTGEELTKASAWRVKVQKFENNHWTNWFTGCITKKLQVSRKSNMVFITLTSFNLNNTK